MSVLDMYNKTVKQLPVADRLRLATMILNDIPPQSLSDYQDEWTDADLRDFASSSMKNAPEYVEGPDDAKAG
jgi:hypothetical protein